MSSVLAHALFPGRAVLMVGEVARAWACTIQHVLDLIEEGEIVAYDIRGKVADPKKPSDLGNATARRCLRIPVSAYDQFLHKRSNQ